MKKIIFILSLICCYILSANASVPDSLNKLLPVDENIRIGKLDNGITYYIRENKKPEKRVELRLVVNAGSILENNDQQGLAHFVEHMCFNGTKHFEKNELVDYLQTIGIKFGADVNAYTSFDETVYMLTIPSDSLNLINKGFLVLEDWAHNVTFDHEEIDKERGVVIEEWRIGQGQGQRIRDKIIPVLFKDSHYADRLPIGKKEIIENAPYDTVISFYHDWYRPDLMAVVVVGDINPDTAEQKIIDHFSGLKMPEKVRPRESYQIPDQKETLVKVVTDPEAPMTILRLFYKRDTTISSTYGDYLDMLKMNLFTGMMNQRLYELREKQNPPFVAAGVVYGNIWARTKDAYQLYAVVGENGIEKGLDALIEENQRVKKYGFTESELDRYKKNMLRGYEVAYKERDKTESDVFASEYIRNFLTQEPIPGISFEYNFVKEYIDSITLDEVNALADQLIKKENEVVIVTAPEKEGVKVLSDDELMSLVEKIESKDVKDYQDKQLGDELLKELPETGEVVQRKKIKEINAEEITFSNGAKVIVKPTTFKNDEILLSAVSPGGYSLYNVDDHFSALQADEIVREGGVNGYSASDIAKILAGKTVYVAPAILPEMESVTANSTPADFESMLQLLYLYFTEPRVNEEAFESFITKRKDLYKNLRAEPLNYFFDQYNRIKAQNNPRGDYLPTDEDWDKINYSRAIDIYRDRFADASDFVFVIVGSINVDSTIDLLARYIGSLPSKNGHETYRDMGIRPPKGMVEENIYKGHDPKSFVNLYFEKEAKWTRKDAFLFGVLADILNRKYIEILREEMSGIYGIRTTGVISKIPYERAWLQIMIPCSPDNVDSLINAAVGEIKKIQTDGVESKDITKAREIYVRNMEENVEKNNYWLSAIDNCVLYGYDFGTIGKTEFLNDITSDELQRVAKEYINTDQYLRVVLYPEEYKGKK